MFKELKIIESNRLLYVNACPRVLWQVIMGTLLSRGRHRLGSEKDPSV